MANLLSSLLPNGYTAPDVQSALGGELWQAICEGTGTNPMEECDKGSLPLTDCYPGIAPWGGYPLCDDGSIPYP